MSIEVNLSPEAAWEATLQELQLQMTKATFNQWLKGAQLIRADDGVYTIGVESPYGRDWLNMRLKDTIEQTLSAINERPCSVEIGVLDEFEAAPALPNGHNGNGRVTVPEPPEEPQAERPWTVHKDGYGGNLTPEQRAELMARIEERKGRESNGKKSKRGRKPKVPIPSRDGQILGPDQVVIEVDESDPLYAFLKTPHYIKRFWQPYIGLVPFALWEALRSYYYFVKNYGADYPTIELLVDTIGYGNRSTILGRSASGNRKEQVGAATILEQHGLCTHKWVGDGRQRVHYFTKVKDKLPLLTPRQVATLSTRKQAEHIKFLKYYEYNIKEWETITEETLIGSKVLVQF